MASGNPEVKLKCYGQEEVLDSDLCFMAPSLKLAVSLNDDESCSNGVIHKILNEILIYSNI